MKNRIAFLLVAFLFIMNTAKAQWIVKNLPLVSNEDLYGISFLNDTTANIVSNTKLITCTNNFNVFNANGISLLIGSSTVTPICNQIRDVYFTSVNNGLITGQFNILNDYDVFGTSNAGGIWNVNYTSNTGSVPRYFMSFDFNGTNALACGSLGRIIKSTNSGVSWAPVSTGTSSDMNDVAYITSNSVICVGDYKLLRSSNGGTSWLSDNSYATESLKNISLTNNNTVVYTCSDNKIFKSVNSGATFSATSTPFNNITCIKAKSTDTIFVGTYAGIYMSYNSGQSWEQFKSTQSYWVNKIEIKGSKVYALCKATRLLISDLTTLLPEPLAEFTITQNQTCDSTVLQLQNNSSTFNSVKWLINGTLVSTNFNYMHTYTSVTGNTDSVTLIVNNGTSTDTLTKTMVVALKQNAIANLGADVYECYGQQVSLSNIGAPAGQTYTWSPSAAIDVFNSASSVLTKPVNGYAKFILTANNSSNCPRTDTINIYTSGDVEESFHPTSPYTTDNCSNAPCNAITSLDFVSPLIGYGFAMSGEVIKTIDGANTWTTTLIGNTSGAYFESGIDFVDANIGYAAGVGKKTVNGGATWTSYNLGRPGSLVQFLNKDTGIVSVPGPNTYEEHSNLYLTLNGATSFTPVYTYTANGDFYMYDIKIIDKNTYLIAGRQYGSYLPRLKKTTDAGATWTNIPMPGSTYISDLAVFGADTIFAIDGSNVVYKTTNGGLSWTSYRLFYFPPNHTSNVATSIEMMNSQVGYASNNFGQLYKTTNGGDCWQQVFNTGIYDLVYSIAIPPTKNAVFFSGEETLGSNKPQVFATQYYRSFNVSLDSNWCANNVIHTRNFSTGYTNYRWFLDNTLYANGRDTVFNFNTTGMHTVRIEADSVGTNLISTTFTLTINPSIGSIGPILGEPFICTMSTGYAQFSAPTNTQVANYYWSTNNTSAIGAGLEDHDSIVNPLFWANNSFTQQIRIFVYGKNLQGCLTSDTASITIQTRKNYPSLVPAVFNVNSHCFQSDTLGISSDTIMVSTVRNPAIDYYIFNGQNFYQQSYKDTTAKIPVETMCPQDTGYIYASYGNACGVSPNSKSNYYLTEISGYTLYGTPDTVVTPTDYITLRCMASLGSALNSCVYKYNWYRNNVYLGQYYYGYYYINSATPSDTGIYKIVQINGCDSVIKTIHVTFPVITGLHNSTAADMDIYPNPNNGSFHISNPQNINATCCIYNNLGQEIYTKKISRSKEEIDLSEIPEGIYYLKMNDGKTIFCKNIVVQRH